MTTVQTRGMANAFDPDKSGRVSEADERLIARRAKALGPAYRLFYSEPVHLVRGEGAWLFDSQGKRYLDAYNNVVSVGHCHPRVTEALARQASALNTHTRYLHEGILDYAERLLATFPSALSHVMLTCSGSEANDLALRISKSFTGGGGFVVTRNAYHGLTDAVAELSPSLSPAAPRGNHVRMVPPPDGFRGQQPVGEVFARNVQAAIGDLRSSGVEFAALVCDSVFSSDGVFTDPPGVLAPAAKVVREAGGLFIADEVQAGFGRTGDALWGFNRHGLIPDLVTLGKPMGNGHPVAGVVMRPEVIADFGRKIRYFNTFAGNPVSCAAAMATLEVIQEERLMENARVVGSYLIRRLRAVAQKREAIADVRGVGLSIGVELVNPSTGEPDGVLASSVVNGLRHRGVLLSATGPHANVLKIRPPLVFAEEHVSLLVDSIEAVLSV